MITYSKDEIVTATEAVRNFSGVLKSVVLGEKKRVVIVKNNKFEAVVLKIEDYERMQEALGLIEGIYKSAKI